MLAKGGQSLLEVAEANQVNMEAGCRMGMCGADPVRVTAGMENLSPVSSASAPRSNGSAYRRSAGWRVVPTFRDR